MLRKINNYAHDRLCTQIVASGEAATLLSMHDIALCCFWSSEGLLLHVAEHRGQTQVCALASMPPSLRSRVRRRLSEPPNQVD